MAQNHKTIKTIITPKSNPTPPTESQQLYCEIFERWVQDNKITDRTIDVVFSRPITPHFSSYDAWKTASPDDYYHEDEYNEPIDMIALNEFCETRWEDDLYYEELMKQSPEERYQAACEWLEYAYEDWKEYEIQQLGKTYEETYSGGRDWYDYD